MIASVKQMEQLGWMLQWTPNGVIANHGQPMTEAEFREALEAVIETSLGLVGTLMPDEPEGGRRFTEDDLRQITDMIAWFPITGRFLQVTNGQPEWADWEHERDG